MLQDNKIHIITPFYRKHLLKTLIYYLEPMNIEWHPVCDLIDIEAFENNNKEWIHPFLCPKLEITDQAFKKINDFIDNNVLVDNDYYCFMGDDDIFEPSMFDIIRKQTVKIIFISLSRGNAVPENAFTPHGTSPLIIIDQSCVKCCSIGLPQFIMKGEILKQMRFNNTSCCDDGWFAEDLVKKFPNDFIFMPNLFAFGNYFEPGRYTNNDWKLKTHWELPQII